MDWNDLKYFLAVAQAGTLTGAAAQLGVSASTVSRRIEAFEDMLGLKLFIPHRDGYGLTRAGRDLVPAAERAGARMRVFERSAQGQGSDLAGPVRIEAPELLSQDVLLPALAGFIDAHPAIQIELRSSVRSVRLAGEEADIILRLIRPERGSYRVRKLGQIPFGLYASAEHVARHGAPLDADDLQRHKVIGWSEDLQYLTMARWLDDLCPGLQPILRLSSLGGQLSAAHHGIGWAVLPTFAAAPAHLVRALGDAVQLSPDMWILVHERSGLLPRVALVRQALEKALMIQRPE